MNYMALDDSLTPEGAALLEFEQAPQSAAERFPRAFEAPQDAFDQIGGSASAGLRQYLDFRLRLGVADDGEEVRVNTSRNPNLVLVGHAGSGKSVLTAGIIESARGAGWMVFVAAGDTHYASLRGEPNVVAAAASVPECARLVREVAGEITKRQEPDRKGGRASREAYPILLVLDEVDIILPDLEKAYGTNEAFLDDLLYIAQAGRSSRVHLVMTSQQSAGRLPKGLGEYMTTVVMGPPVNDVIRDAFPGDEAQAERICAARPAHCSGYALARIQHRALSADLVEFHTYEGFTRLPAENRSESWDRYRRLVDIRRSHPRLWWAVDESFGESLEQVYSTPTVMLDEGFPILPDLAMIQYDPGHPDYLLRNGNPAPRSRAPKSEMPRRTIRIPDEEWDAASAAARRCDETISTVVRRALSTYAMTNSDDLSYVTEYRATAKNTTTTVQPHVVPGVTGEFDDVRDQFPSSAWTLEEREVSSYRRASRRKTV